MSSDSIGAGSTSQREYHGYAAADKDNGSRTLYVYCEELLPFVSGEIRATTIASNISTTDGKNKFTGSATTKNFIECTYRDDSGSNNAFPPDIRRGEQVRIFNIGDTDQWYWAPTGRNDNARRTERKRFSISDTLQNSPELDDDNTYYIEMNTRTDQKIEISTANSNGEQFRYKFTISPKTNTVTLCDDGGNLILIESDKPRISLVNSSNSMIQMDGVNITVACNGDMKFKADGNITMVAGQNITMNAGSNLKATAGNVFAIDSASSSSLTLNPSGAGTLSCNSLMTLKAANISMSKI